MAPRTLNMNGGGLVRVAGAALTVDSGAAPLVDHTTVEVDQNVMYYDSASGKIKGKAIGASASFVAANPVLLGAAGSGLLTWPLGLSGTQTPAANVLQVQPVVFDRAATIALGCHIATIGSSGAVIRFGVYSDSAGSPGSLLADLGTVIATATGNPVTTTTVAVLAGVRYWIGLASQGSPGTAPIVTQVTVPGGVQLPVPSGVTVTNFYTAFCSANTVSGALPGTFVQSGNALAAAGICIEAI